ncbi:hypothetical protein S40285_01666 [Stachybotrys chlorohalonatus IBT 40285]|uniref:Chromatin assembly factor 1 subunit A n=1 Tax=Stachybotrys chlorohalonatus (strain IBT 40285) TaxID=1283841 RepID=A0A084QDY4_STAC4|nr:hypothetical protein S40285_01666 [Stachybotrys chlorohalonata IBT 40285]
MTLFDRSPNIQEMDVSGRKRSHDEYANEGIVKLGSAGSIKAPQLTPIQPTVDYLVPSSAHCAQDSPQGSPALTDAGSSTPNRASPAPLTPSKDSIKMESPQTSKLSASTPSTSQATSSASAPNKRKRLTPAEKELQAKEREQKQKDLEEKRKEREAKLTAQAAEKARQEEDKAARAKERDEKKKQREEEIKAKAQQRDEKRRKKEEEQQRLQQEKEKKARAQPTLTNFFKGPSTPKKPCVLVDKHQSPCKDTAEAGDATKASTAYEKLFRPFFIKDHVTVASLGPRLDHGLLNEKLQNVDKAISRQQVQESVPDIAALKDSRSDKNAVKRGRLYYPVKHVMETMYLDTQNAFRSGTDDSNKIIMQAREKLEKVPMKIISFSQDVRPPYCGTITFRPYVLGERHMRKLARKPLARDVLPLDYDYDSEAEWQEEEGEDVDMDDEEEELDEEDDMDGFLDDSDESAISRRVLLNTVEPESSGVCFEDVERFGPNQSVYEYKMEIIHDVVADPTSEDGTVDPWTSEYWGSEAKAKPAKVMEMSEKPSKMAPPPTPGNAFEALKGNDANSAVPGKMVKPELLNDVKKLILKYKKLNKAGILELVFNELRSGATRVEVKNTIEHVAEKSGKKRSSEWTLRAGHEVTA